jgi:hypothetical protein
MGAGKTLGHYQQDGNRAGKQNEFRVGEAVARAQACESWSGLRHGINVDCFVERAALPCGKGFLVPKSMSLLPYAMVPRSVSFFPLCIQHPGFRSKEHE